LTTIALPNHQLSPGSENEPRQLVFDFPITPRYGFDNFVVCDGNRTPFRMARLVVDGGHRLLYLFGPSGSGKTHLLRAMGQAFYQQGGGEGFPYLSFRQAEEIYGGDYSPERSSLLAERFAGAPILLVDDLQLMPDDEAVRVELWQLFNDFYLSGRPIVITGDRSPRELANIDGHLSSRLLWGLVAELDVSDDESRRRILAKLAEDRQILLPGDVIDYLITFLPRDIPSLLSALDILRRYALATGRRITTRLAREALAAKG
jgi:chromosomal replication initiator protein